MRLSHSASVVIRVALVLAAGCGGGSTSSSPTSPSPSPGPPPGASPCSAIGGLSAGTLGIVNGAACVRDRSPVVLLNLKDSLGDQVGQCSGTVIAPRAVLTAAHCLDEETAAVKIFTGSGEQIDSSAIAAYPGYRPNDSSSLDVGVVLTDADLPRAPMALLTSRDARVGEQAVIAGWGRDETGVGTVLRAGFTSISSVASVFLATEYSSTGSSVCSGDSGGPLLLDEGGVWAVAGVTSSVTQSGACTAGTNYYVRVRNSDVRAFVLGLVPNAVQR